MKTTVTQETLKVAAHSSVKKVANVLAVTVQENGFGELQAIGAGAVNQATKAVVVARGLLATMGYEITCVPAFMNVEIEGNERTAIKFIVQLR